MDREQLQHLMEERIRQDMFAALDRARERSYRLPDGRYVLPVWTWVGMHIETPKIWDYQERKDAVEDADFSGDVYVPGEV